MFFQKAFTLHEINDIIQFTYDSAVILLVHTFFVSFFGAEPKKTTTPQ